MASDVIELRLPPDPQYLGVLRATTGVIAGDMSFNYDQIIQLRTAVGEAFELAIKSITKIKQDSKVGQLIVRFAIEPDRLEIRVPAPTGYTTYHLTEDEMESRALLASLVDELEFGAGAAGEPMVHMVKYKVAGEAL